MKINLLFALSAFMISSCCSEKDAIPLGVEDDILSSQAGDTMRYVNQSHDTAVYILHTDSIYTEFANRQCLAGHKRRDRRYSRTNTDFITVTIKRNSVAYFINADNIVTLGYTAISTTSPHLVNINLNASSPDCQELNNLSLNGKIYPYAIAFTDDTSPIFSLIVVPEIGVVSFQYANGEKWTLLP